MSETPALRRLLVTGGAGFIGSCYVRDVLGRRDGTRITVLDKLTYAGNEANLAPVRDDPEMAARFAFVRGDIADAGGGRAARRRMPTPSSTSPPSRTSTARSSSPRRSWRPASSASTSCSRRAARPPDRPRYLQVSTDEVYGSVDEGHAREDAPLAPRSPYAAAKAAGELLVRSYVITHGVDAVVTRGSNTYGPYHHPEKLIPLFVTNALDDRPLPLYGDGLQRREWLYVSDHAAAIDHVLRHGETGETYNIAGPTERTNRDVVALLLDHLGKPWSLVMQVEDRPGHDRRYAMDGAKLAALGWQPRTDVRGRPGGDGRLVPGERGVVARGPLGRLGRLVRAPVRPAAGDRGSGRRERAGRRERTDRD